MPSATASGADAGNNNSSARNRDHNQGNQDRKYSPDQKAAVIRIRKCNATAYYEILALEKSASDNEIKKAYRKLSLLTHPDKNGYEGADEAFKLVSRAFQVLSDPEKKSRYDKFGGDPDSRFNASAAGPSGAASHFPSGFGGFQSAGGPMFEEEISPEELFNRFFNGGFGGMGMGRGFGPFGGGSQFVFNMGGGPGFRVHQFGGAQPRRRPRDARDAQSAEETTDFDEFWAGFRRILPFLLLFLLPLLSSIFSESSPSGPSYVFEVAKPPHTMKRTTPEYGVPYWLNPRDVEDYSAKKLSQLDKYVETDYINTLQYHCENERNHQNRLMREAGGWIFQDVEKMKYAQNMDLPSCRRLNSLSKKK